MEAERPEGNESPRLTPLGLGAWAMGGFGWGPQDDGDSVATILRAVELGVGWIDTAAVYGRGHAERVVARALAELPPERRPLVFTKGGRVWDESRGEVVTDLEPGSLRRECEASLQRLGVVRIDLYQLHWPAEAGPPIEESWGLLAELVEEGKARWIGVSNFDVELLERCRAVRRVDTVQAPLSLIDRRAAADVVPWAAANGTTVLAYSPMQSGLLTGAITRERLAAMPDTDWRPRRPEFTGERLERNLALVERLRPIAAELGATLPELAIAWVLAWPGVHAIAGARRPEQVDEWIGAAGVSLSPSVLDEVEGAIEATDSGDGPSRPA